MLGYQGPAQPSPALGDALNAGYLYLEVKCLGCDTHQTLALDIVRRRKTTPIHEMERYMRCRRCSELQGYPFKRSHLVALKSTTISTISSAFGVVAGRSLDHVVRRGQQCRRHGKAQRLRRLQVDHKIELGRLLDRKISRLGAFEDLADIDPAIAIAISEVGSVADQTSQAHIFSCG
jgi:hypothetical protein